MIPTLKFELMESGWSAREELLFLHGLEIFGYGNWDDVAKHIQTKDAYQVEFHWDLCY